jgi:hypothetical protein
MGFSILVVIEYDESPRGGAPFSALPSGIIPLQEFLELRSCEDQHFVATCMAGVGPSTVSTRRGLPVNVSPQTLVALDYADSWENTTWLNHKEIRESIEISGISSNEWNFGPRIVLRMMGFLAQELGEDRVRLILCVV